MQLTYQKYRNIVVEVASPENKGSGVFLTDSQLIATTLDNVHNFKNIVIQNARINKQSVAVIFIDELYNLAILDCPVEIKKSDFPKLQLGNIDPDSKEIVAFGKSFNRDYSITEGEILEESDSINPLKTFRHSAHLDICYSGCPAFNKSGLLIGINRFNHIGTTYHSYGIPSQVISSIIDYIKREKVNSGARCTSCNEFVSRERCHNSFCNNCGAHVDFPSNWKKFKPTGIGAVIEDIIKGLGYEIATSRTGLRNWEITHGSARISIMYYEKNGLIIGDAYLCNLPDRENKRILSYLMQENYSLENLSFCVREGKIILSLIIYDKYLNKKTGSKLFKYLFERADHYDNILVNDYKAIWNRDYKLF